MSTRKAATVGDVAFLEEGPRVLSVYEGFFSGGARALHNAAVRSLDATTPQRHSVLSLSDRSIRESTTQAARDDAGYRRLVAAGLPVRLLHRVSSQPLRPSHRAALEQAVLGADVVLSLKEQPLTALAQIGTAGRPVIACLHRSDPEHQGSSLEALVALVDRGTVTTAVCCATSTQAAYHAATGIPLERLPVIPNGVDLHRFRPVAADRESVRRRLGVAGDAPVVLLSARFDPMKDVGLFTRAASAFAAAYPHAHVVLCGAGMSAANPELVTLLEESLGGWAGAHDQVHLLGIRDDMPHLYNASDLVVLTSAYGEAAPLSLLEGMACGAVPVTTDVGDAAAMVGDSRLVTSREPSEVALAWAAAFEQREEHAERILRRRQRLSEQRTFDAYAALVDRHARTLPLELAV
jgi:glycosyl transferase family 1/glycosyl transferase family 4